MKTFVIIALLTILVPACAASVQEPVAPVAAQTQLESETIEVTVYDREGLDALVETLDWAGYDMAPGYPQKLRFSEGWLVLAYQQ